MRVFEIVSSSRWISNISILSLSEYDFYSNGDISSRKIDRFLSRKNSMNIGIYIEEQMRLIRFIEDAFGEDL